MSKTKIFNALLAAAISLTVLSSGSSAGSLSGMCPLPYKYQVVFNGKDMPNQFPPNYYKAYANALSTYYYIVVESPEDVKPEPIEEDQENKYAFRAFSSNGSGMYPKEINVGDSDQTTADKYADWMPNLNDYHPLRFDLSPSLKNKMAEHPSCYEFCGEPYNESVRWEWQGPQGWQCEKVFFIYHMDSPTFFGNYGGIGYNPDENDPPKFERGKSEFLFTYYVPSVPVWYAVTSVMSLRWTWPHKYSHKWKIKHVGAKGKDKCDGCGLDMFDVQTIEQKTYAEKPFEYYWTDEKDKYYCCRQNEGENDGKCTKNWKTSKFYSTKFLGENKIQNPLVADERVGSSAELTGFDKFGIEKGIKLYSEGFDYGDLNTPVITARSTFYVKDKGNIAHIQTGIEGTGNVINADCGKPISANMSGKSLTIRIADNDPWANKYVLDQFNAIGTSDNGVIECPKGEWSDRRFNVNFWYEIPLYQFASFLSEKWSTPGGVENHEIESVYSPVFVWKKVSWPSLGAFLSNDDGSKTTSYFYTKTSENGKPVEHTGVPFNPMYVVYEKKIPVSNIFVDIINVKENKKPVEEIAPLFYAKTSLGDAFGNPPYDAVNENKLFGADFQDANGKQVIDIFHVKPINFTKGKGPLKYFVEVQDGSQLTKGGGLEEEKYNCDGRFMTDRSHFQGLLKFNPDVVKYLPHSKDAPPIGKGVAVDTTNDPGACKSFNYDKKVQQAWKECARLLNNVNSNVDSGSAVVENFQAFGKVEVNDRIRPNLGLKIVNTVTGSIRKVYKLNDISRLKMYSKLVASPDSAFSPYMMTADGNIAQVFNYQMLKKESSVGPRPLFSNDEPLWLFEDVKLLADNNPGPYRIIYEGRDQIGKGDSVEDSLDPYGTTEDTPIQFTHQDLRNDGKKADFFEFFAHDNIDGQRLIKSGKNAVREDWYKGVTSFDFDKDVEKQPVFPEDLIPRGYTSWKIIDETFKDYATSPAFKKIHMSGDYYRYPMLTFNNPNCKPDGTKYYEEDKEISVMYGVADRAGNFRRLKLKIFVMPVDNKINVIERKN